MKESIKFVLLGMLVVFAMSITFFLYQIWTTSTEDNRITEAKVNVQVQDIYWYSTAYKIAFAAILVVCLISILMLTYSIARSRLKKASVHTYKIGKHSEVIVHEKDLSLAAPIAKGLVKAERLKQRNKGIERALQLSTQMVMQVLGGKRGFHVAPLESNPSLPEQVPIALPPFQSGQVPTFQELLVNEEIAPGKPMILGYENGAPRRGSFLDIYSAAVAGESGSGKTATLLFLIGSGLVSSRVRFLAIDPHYPHPKSLGFKTKPLWEEGLMRRATSKEEILAVLAEVERIIDHRLQQIDKDTTPVVLVIDELAFLSKTSIGSALAHTMERISTEGRKCDVYMLASSQTWLAARTGDSSVVRDTLTSAYVHRIKPKQATLLLQDKAEAEKVKKYIKQPGDVLFCPVNDESTICKMPYTTEADMLMVAEMLRRQVVDVAFEPVNHEDDLALSGKHVQGELPAPSTKLAEKIPPSKSTASEPFETKTEKVPPLKSAGSEPFETRLVEILREQMETSPFDNKTWQKQLSEASGVSELLIKRVIERKQKLTPQTAKKLLPHLFHKDG